MVGPGSNVGTFARRTRRGPSPSSASCRRKRSRRYGRTWRTVRDQRDVDEAEAMVVWIESATNGLLWAYEIEETDHEIMVLRKLARLLRDTEPEPIF